MIQSTEIHSPVFYVTFEEVCNFANINTEYMLELVEYEIAVPITGKQPQEWQFSVSTVTLANKAARLHRDLEIDWADIKLVLNLLEEIDQLKNENQQLKQQLNRLLTS
jgi:chaperone modulatory protein CbpM